MRFLQILMSLLLLTIAGQVSAFTVKYTTDDGSARDIGETDRNRPRLFLGYDEGGYNQYVEFLYFSNDEASSTDGFNDRYTKNDTGIYIGYQNDQGISLYHAYNFLEDTFTYQNIVSKSGREGSFESTTKMEVIFEYSGLYESRQNAEGKWENVYNGKYRVHAKMEEINGEIVFTLDKTELSSPMAPNDAPNITIGGFEESIEEGSRFEASMDQEYFNSCADWSSNPNILIIEECSNGLPRSGIYFEAPLLADIPNNYVDITVVATHFITKEERTATKRVYFHAKGEEPFSTATVIGTHECGEYSGPETCEIEITIDNNNPTVGDTINLSGRVWLDGVEIRDAHWGWLASGSNNESHDGIGEGQNLSWEVYHYSSETFDAL